MLRPHARGGLGAVFVALDAELQREVALKQILDHHADDPDSRQRFLLEAEITGGLEHPGIVPVYGLGTYADGRPFYAMRFIEGESLKEAIERFHGEQRRPRPGQRSLELRKLLRHFIDVCNALSTRTAVACCTGTSSRPTSSSGKHGETLVVDWGLAKPLGRVRAGEPTPRSGRCVPSSASGIADTLPGVGSGDAGLHEPRAGPRRPRPARPALRRLQPGSHALLSLDRQTGVRRRRYRRDLGAVQRGDFPPPRKLDPTIDRALEAICIKAMSQRPEDRYESCKALADDIDRWMADESVAAWKEPWNRKLVRWLTRHRTAVTAAGAAAGHGRWLGWGPSPDVQARANGELKKSNDALSTANARVVQANLQLKEANENVTRANTELQAANVREHERFDLAMEAIKLFHGDISKDLLLKQKQFETLRAKLLRGAADFYAKLEGLLKERQDKGSRARSAAPTRNWAGSPSASAIPREPWTCSGRRSTSAAYSARSRMPTTRSSWTWRAPSARTENCWRG